MLLTHGAETRCRLRVTHVALNGADEERICQGAVFAEDVGDGVEFLGVADLCSGPVSFDIGHVAGRDAGFRVDFFEEAFLHGAGGEGDSLLFVAVSVGLCVNYGGVRTMSGGGFLNVDRDSGFTSDIAIS